MRSGGKHRLVVRHDPVFVRRRRIALLAVVGVLAVAVLGTTRVFGLVGGEPAEAAPAPKPAAAKPTPAKPTPSIPVPKPSPVEAQGDPGPSEKTALLSVAK